MTLKLISNILLERWKDVEILNYQLLVVLTRIKPIRFWMTNDTIKVKYSSKYSSENLDYASDIWGIAINDDEKQYTNKMITRLR